MSTISSRIGCIPELFPYFFSEISPEPSPWKGSWWEECERRCAGRSAAKNHPWKGDRWGFVREDEWVFAGRSDPLKGRKSWGFERESVRGETRRKVAKIQFFRFWKTAIFRQTMDKNRGQRVHYKKDVHRVIELNSIFSQFLMQNFVFLLILAGQEGQKLREIPWSCENWE